MACATLGCIAPDLVNCDSGLSCPVGDRCDEVHRSCVSPDQFAVCDGAADGADCTAGPVSGGCFAGVCLARGCGNRVIEPGEACDDGNQISGDGCSGNCQSTERCGDGIVENAEQCDDGNLMSRDGCDSQCLIEDVGWTLLGIAPDVLAPRMTAYDPVRGRLVSLTSAGNTWEWDGARWSVVDWQLAPAAVYYNPDDLCVEMIAADTTGATRRYRWQDARWQPVGTEVGALMLDVVAAVYDPVGHRVIAIGASWTEDTIVNNTWAIDGDGAWHPLASFTSGAFDMVAAYDPVSASVVVETSAGTEWTFDGDAWSGEQVGFTAEASLGFHPGLGRLVLVDGALATMFERVAGVWQPIAGEVPSTVGVFRRPLYYDAARAELVLLGADGSQLARWDGAWTAQTASPSARVVGAGYDPVTRVMFLLDNPRPEDPDAPIRAWSRTATGWREIDAAPGPRQRRDAPVVYSPGRAALVMVGGLPFDSCDGDCEPLTDTWAFDGTHWTSIAAPAPFRADVDARIGYDPVNRRAVLSSVDEFWMLGDDDDTWRPLELPSTDRRLIFGVAWNARSAGLLAMISIHGASSPLFELQGDRWVPMVFVPAQFDLSSTGLINDERAGGVIMVDPASGLSWERVGASWYSLPGVPSVMDMRCRAYNPVDGATLIAGAGLDGAVAAVMTRTSATPLESCSPGQDADGDSLAGCDDPDCYWACAGSLPYTALQ